LPRQSLPEFVGGGAKIFKLPGRSAVAPSRPDPLPPPGIAAGSSGQTQWGGQASNGASWEVYRGDARLVLQSLPAERFSCVVTSPPYYWQRDYKVGGQIGQEATIEGYVKSIADTLDQVRRVLCREGLLFLNLGDTYYSAKGQPKGDDRKNSARRFGLRAVDASGLGVPRKTAIGIPWRVALEMIGRGWILRSPIVWRREGCLPEPTAKDRPWRSYEMVFMFSKSPRYHFNREELGNDEDIWTISDRPTKARGIHSAAFPDQLVQKCLSIGCPPSGSVLDPFAGSGTVARVAIASGRPTVAVELNQDFCEHIAAELRRM
jgi:DNA modification methylase